MLPDDRPVAREMPHRERQQDHGGAGPADERERHRRTVADDETAQDGIAGPEQRGQREQQIRLVEQPAAAAAPAAILCQCHVQFSRPHRIGGGASADRRSGPALRLHDWTCAEPATIGPASGAILGAIARKFSLRGPILPKFALKPMICSIVQQSSAADSSLLRPAASIIGGRRRDRRRPASGTSKHQAGCWGQILMANVVVVGSQWGDEGKGKIVDWLSEQADIVVRFQGGHNAGHTLVINGVTYKLSLLPSGVVRPGKLSVIGNGVVLDPQALINEIATLKEQGVAVSPDNLRIAENATLILPLHRELDAIREESASASLRIGTTRRGIGPAYEDKVGRRAIRLMDLADGATLERKIERLLTHHNALRKGLGLDPIDPRQVRKELDAVAPAVLPFMDSVWSMLDQHRRDG